MNSEANSSDLLVRYQRLIEISRDLASTLDLAALLNRIVQTSSDLIGAEAASILLYDEAKGQLYFNAVTNLDERLMKGLVVPVEGSLAGWILTKRQPVRLSDTQRDPRHFEGIADATQITTRSMLGVPLVARDKEVGVLEVINKLHGEFTQEDEDLLMVLGAQAAVAIENARLFQQSDMISELVHELRTPLTSLNAAAALLIRPQVTGPLRTNIAQVIFDETKRLSELTSDYLDLARLESGRIQFQIQQFSLQQVVDECINLMEGNVQEAQIDFWVDFPEDLPLLRADRDRIKRLVLNLLSNAVKYSPPAGIVKISARFVQEQMRLSISDKGPGIPSESIPYLYDKFYRVPGSEKNVPGTGLGLSICKRIVEAHQGTIEIESHIGQGTTFIVTLPQSINK